MFAQVERAQLAELLDFVSISNQSSITSFSLMLRLQRRMGTGLEPRDR